MFNKIFLLYIIFPPGNQLASKAMLFTLLPNYRIHLYPMGKGKYTVFTAQNLLIQEMPVKHPNDVLFILMVYCFPPTNLKYFIFQLILAVSKHFFRDVLALHSTELAGKGSVSPLARCSSLA